MHASGGWVAENGWSSRRRRVIPVVLRVKVADMEPNPYQPPTAETVPLPRNSGQMADDSALRYVVDFEDIMGFQRFHFAHSPTMRNQRFGLIGVVSFLIVALCLLALPEHSLTQRLGIAVPLVLLNGIIAYFLLKWSISSQTRKLLSEGSNSGILGDHELRLDERGLTEITSVNESRHAYSGISRIEETSDYAFIYISSLQAHVVPKRKILDGDIGSFMSNIRKRVPTATRRTRDRDRGPDCSGAPPTPPSMRVRTRRFGSLQ
jgi:hypothetical protein